MPNPNYPNDSHNETFRLAVTESLLSVFSSVGIVSPGMSNKACGRAVCSSGLNAGMYSLKKA